MMKKHSILKKICVLLTVLTMGASASCSALEGMLGGGSAQGSSTSSEMSESTESLTSSSTSDSSETPEDPGTSEAPETPVMR